MLRLTEQKFDQQIFVAQYKHLLGKEAQKAMNMHQGLCQALCIIIALKGHDSPLVDTLLASGHNDPIEDVLRGKSWSEFRQSRILDEKSSHVKQLFYLLEEVAIKAHPLNVISSAEKLYRVAFDKLSLGSKIFENKQNLLTMNENLYEINRELLSNLLDQYEDDRYIQLTFMQKPRLNNRFSLGGHATLLFKSEDEFYYFDPQRGLYISEEFDEIGNQIDLSLQMMHNAIKQPMHIGIIDLKTYLELYKSLDWIKEIQDKTPTDDASPVFLGETNPRYWLSRQLSALMQEAYSDTDSKGENIGLDKSYIKTLLDLKADPNHFCTSSFETPLHFAKYAKCKDIQDLLIEYKADETMLDSFKQLKIYEDILKKKASLSLLLKFKEIMKNKNYAQLDAFILSYNKMHKDSHPLFEVYMTKYLLQQFHSFIDRYDVDSIKHLIENISGQELRETLLDSRDINGNTALIKSVIYSKLEMITFLLEQNVNTTTYNAEKNTALILAVKNNKLDIVKEILDHSTESLEIRDIFDKNPAACAIEMNSFTIFEILVKKGASLGGLDSFLKRCEDEKKIDSLSMPKFNAAFLNYAVMKDNWMIFSLFKEKIIQPNDNSQNILDFIYFTAKQGHLEIMKVFIHNKYCLTDEIKPFNFVTTAMENKHFALAGHLLQYMNNDPAEHKFNLSKASINEIISHYIESIEKHGWILPPEKIKLYESIMEQKNSFGKLIAMQYETIKPERGNCLSVLFLSKKNDPFSAFEAVLAVNQKTVAKQNSSASVPYRKCLFRG